MSSKSGNKGSAVEVKKLFWLLSLVLVLTLFAFVSAQGENATPAQPQQSVQQTANTEKDNLIESQRNLDRSLNILNAVSTSMGTLVSLLNNVLTVAGIIIAIAVALGVLEIKRWQQLRKNVEKDVNFIRKARCDAENELEALRKTVGNVPPISSDKQPINAEIKEKLDNFNRKLELLEILGATLKPEDYFNRGNDLYYKGKAELSLKAFEKAIELKPDWADAWDGKGVTLEKLNRFDEALKAFEKAIELKPDLAETWDHKGVMLSKLGKLDEALKAIEKAIELKPDFAGAWYNNACIYSLKGDKEKVLSDLEKAIKLDASYKEKAKNDEDFKLLRRNAELKKLTE